MEPLIRIGLAALLMFLVMFPYGILHSQGRAAGKMLATVVGVVISLGPGLIFAAPDFQPRSATVFAIVMLTLVGGTVVPVTVGIIDRTLNR